MPKTKDALFYCDAGGPLVVRQALLPKGWRTRYLDHSSRLIIEQEFGEREVAVFVSATQDGINRAILVYFEADGDLLSAHVVDSDYGEFLKRLSSQVLRKIKRWM